MFSKTEIRDILIISIILAFSVTLFKGFQGFLIALASMAIILLFNITSKKISAEYFELSARAKIWEFKRFGHKPTMKFSKPIPAGAIFPIMFSIILIFLNGFTWMASLVFNVKAKPYRVAKRHGYYSFSEVGENHLAYIAATGIFVNLLLALAGYLTGFENFAQYNLWFTFFNLIPISNIDGNKIFFGSYLLWAVLSIITLLALVGSFVVA